MQSDIFKTYDIRGVYPEKFNEDAARAIGRALGGYFAGRSLIVARDARISSPAIYAAVLEGVAETHRGSVLRVGIATTPMFYFLVNRKKAGGGIMVTASHNPKNYNGLKVVRRGASMIGGREVLRIVRRYGE